MDWRRPLLTAVTLMSFSGAAYAGCEAGTKIDASTADMAKRKIEHAGFSSVRGLKKGCDNFWHGKAVKDGVEGLSYCRRRVTSCPRAIDTDKRGAI
jgi:hypothetical protein